MLSSLVKTSNLAQNGICKLKKQMTFESLLRKIKKNSPQADPKKIREAYNFAKERHKGQYRKTGEEFIKHPILVADFLANFNFNTATFVAALLHDIAEDTKTNLKTIENKFGKEVVVLVKGLTKLKKLKSSLSGQSLEDYSAENLRKMFLAMATDIRVVLIKLADRLHNVKTLAGHKPSKRKRIAKETIEIYAPLANRLGMGEVKGQLEDYAFPYLYPSEYQETKKLYTEKIATKETSIKKIQKQVAKKLKEENVTLLDIHGRTKHLYSLYKKMIKRDDDINKIYDLVAIRIIVKDISDCYKVLGIIHKNWRPLIGRIKDYIALPKANGYRSLHTSTISKKGEIIEFQIRTAQMHEEAEYGIAAHWNYSEKEKPKDGDKASVKQINWIKQLAKWQQDVTAKIPSSKFLESLKIDIFKDRIFAFTPKGQVHDLPEGASPVDFAYHVHTDIGNHCRAARVNDKLVSLDYILENGDRVEIIKDKKAIPNRDWLDFVKTNLARNKIKNWFKRLDRDENIELGQRLLNDKLVQLKKRKIENIPKNQLKELLKKYNVTNLEGLFIQIALDDLKTNNVIKSLYKQKDLITPKKKRFALFSKPTGKQRATVAGEKGFLTNIAKCCNPSLENTIKAHITRSRGASIHRANCPELAKQTKGRIVKSSWEEKTKMGHLKIEVEAIDRVGALKDLTITIAQAKANITNIKIKSNPKKNTTSMLFTLEIKNIDQIFDLFSQIRKIEGIVDVRRKI